MSECVCPGKIRHPFFPLIQCITLLCFSSLGSDLSLLLDVSVKYLQTFQRWINETLHALSTPSLPPPQIQNNNSLGLFLIFQRCPMCEGRVPGMWIFFQIGSALFSVVCADLDGAVSLDMHYLAEAETSHCNANKQLSPCWENCNKTFSNRAPTRRRMERSLALWCHLARQSRQNTSSYFRGNQASMSKATLWERKREEASL